MEFFIPKRLNTNEKNSSNTRKETGNVHRVFRSNLGSASQDLDLDNSDGNKNELEPHNDRKSRYSSSVR